MVEEAGGPMSDIALKRLHEEVDLSDLWPEEILLLEALASAHWEEDDVAIRSHKQLASICASMSDDKWRRGKVLRYRRRLEARGLIRVRNKDATKLGKTAFEYELIWLANPPRMEQRDSDSDPNPNANTNPDSDPDSNSASSSRTACDGVASLELDDVSARVHDAHKTHRDDLARRALRLVAQALLEIDHRREERKKKVPAHWKSKLLPDDLDVLQIALETVEAVALPKNSKRRVTILLRVINDEPHLDGYKRRKVVA